MIDYTVMLQIMYAIVCLLATCYAGLVASMWVEWFRKDIGAPLLKEVILHSISLATVVVVIVGVYYLGMR